MKYFHYIFSKLILIPKFIPVLIPVLILLFIILLLFIYIFNLKLIIKDSNKLIEDSLNENEILLKEIHHRVKNNLQLIISMLNIQSQINNVDDFVDLSSKRINSIMLLHQYLYQFDSFSNIDFKNYIYLLTESILEIFDKKNSIQINLFIDNIKFSQSTAMPLGLILNEIVSNSLKHAFTNREYGFLNISVIQLKNNFFQLIIEDNGIGFSSDYLSKQSFGLELINLLAKQLNGTIIIDTEKYRSTKYLLNFQEIKS